MNRKAKTSDIHQIVSLEKRVLGQSLGEAFLLQEIENNPQSIYWVCEINHEIVGYIGFRFTDEKAEMMNFVVSERFQGKGIGTTLMEEAEQSLKAAKVKTIILEVRKSNEKAQRFYQRQAFEYLLTRKNYYDHEDAYVYLKEI